MGWTLIGSSIIFVFANDQDQSSRWIYPPCCSMCVFSIVFVMLSLLYLYLIWMDLCWSQSDCRCICISNDSIWMGLLILYFLCICISNDSIWMGLLRGEPAGLPCLLLSVRPGSSICELLLPSQRLPRFFNFQIFACFFVCCVVHVISNGTLQLLCKGKAITWEAVGILKE